MEIRLNQHRVPICHWTAEEQQELSPGARRLFEQLYKGASLALTQTEEDLPMIMNVLANVLTNLLGPMRAACPPSQRGGVLPLFILTLATYLKDSGFLEDFTVTADGMQWQWQLPDFSSFIDGETPGAVP